MQTSLLVFFITGFIFSALSIPLIKNKVKMNAWYGIRTLETMRDEKVWYEVNSKMGKYLFVFGSIISGLSIYFSFFPLKEEYEMVYSLLGVLILGTVIFVKRAFRMAYNLSNEHYQNQEEKE